MNPQPLPNRSPPPPHGQTPSGPATVLPLPGNRERSIPRLGVEAPARFVVVESVYHQVPGEEPTTVQTAVSRFLQTGEQPYERKGLATAEWQLLDCGWVKDVRLLHLTNLEGGPQQVQSSREEEWTTQQRRIELGVGLSPSTIAAAFCLPPQESLRGTPAAPGLLWVRCPTGKARYRIVLIPE